MDLSIIIVTFNSESVIGDCLDALGEWAGRTLVVDNASKDNSVALVKKRGVELKELSQNTGFARGANTGARLAKGKVLCFLNPDCLPSEELLKRGYSAVNQARALAAVPFLYETGGLKTDGRQPGYTRLKLCHDILSTAYPIKKFDKRIKNISGYHDRNWSWPHGACFFIKREVFLKLGGFDSRLFTYMEDVDLGYKLWRAGGGLVQLNHEIRHQTASGSNISIAHRRWLMTAGRVKYGKLHYGTLWAVMLGMAALPGLVIKGLLK